MSIEASALNIHSFNPLEVTLNIFEGPLELLLQLIRQSKMDIQTVSLAEICEPYLQYLEHLEQMNLDIAGEFLSIASTLIFIKSKSLLPDPEPEIDEEASDPEESLRQKLIEYERFKKVSQFFAQRDILGKEVFHRPQLDEIEEISLPSPFVLEDISVYSLLKAYHKAIQRKKSLKPHEVVTDEKPIENTMIQFMKLLEQKKDHCLFRDLLSFPCSLAILAISFLAVLELTKMKLVKLIQVQEFGAIHCQPYPEIGSHIGFMQEALSNEKSLDSLRTF